MSGNVFVSVRTRDDELVTGQWLSTIDAILRMQEAIERLRRMAAPTFDASWGEQPLPLIAPTAAELAESTR